MEEDMLLKCNADKSQSVYIKHNIDGSTFDMTSIGDKVLMGRTPIYESAGWSAIKKLNLDGLVMYPLEVGGTTATGWADSYYNPVAEGGLRGAACLGDANVGDFAGSAFLYGNHAPSAANAFLAACLCEFERPFSTVPTLFS